ncbi:MAG: Ig-like domain repeat protein [Clostridiales bacterium]|nr:Ig-like domain repeat protein [Clostridiales bacterium]
MNAKDKLIEKLLRSAKKHKVLTYPVLALVAIISFFGNLFNWHNGTGKRVVAVIMVMVMFVSQSYFLTSSATSLVDTEEEALIQKELQETSVEREDDTEASKEAVSKQEEKDTADTEASLQKEDEANEQSADTESEEETMEENVGTPAVEGEDVTTEVSDVTDADADEEETDTKLDNENEPVEQEKITCLFYTVDESGSRTLLYTYPDILATEAGATYNLSGIVADESFTAAVNNQMTGTNGEKYEIYSSIWYSDDKLNGNPVNLTSVSVNASDSKEGKPQIHLFCKKVLAQYQVNIEEKKSNNDSNLRWTGDLKIRSTNEGGNGTYQVNIDNVGSEEEKYGYLTLTEISRTGYSLFDIQVDNGEVTSKTENSAVIKLTGNGVSRKVTLIWKPDIYYIDYVKSMENETDIVRQEVTYDGNNTIYEGANRVVPPDGYVFSGYWKMKGRTPEQIVLENSPVFSYQSVFYTGPECVVTLEPVNQYDDVELTTSTATFTFKEKGQTSLIQAKYKNASNLSNGSNFIYNIQNESKNKLDEYGIRFETVGNTGFQLVTNENGPSKSTGGTTFDILIDITDTNAKNNETISPQPITITINQYQVELQIPDDMKTTKVYDGTTTPLFSITGQGTLDTNVPEIKVNYNLSKVAYNSENVEEANRIIFTGQLTMVAAGDDPSKVNVNNYILKTDQNGGYSIPGSITPKEINVIPELHFQNGKDYVRAGEDDPQFTFTVNPNDLVERDRDESNLTWLSDITYETNRPADLTEECLGNRACMLSKVISPEKTVGSNYSLSLRHSDAVAKSYEVKRESTVEGTNFYIVGDRSSDDNEWYFNKDGRGISIIPGDVYNTIMISTSGENGAYHSLESFTDEYSNSSNVWIYLKSDRGQDGGTGAVSKKVPLNVKYDGIAPEYVKYSFSQQGADGKELTFVKGDTLPDGGLYFPGIGGVLDFGTYTNATIMLKVQYEDKMSGLKTLHYGLFGDEPNSSVNFDKTTGCATIEVLGSLAKNIGNISCYAEDVAGNKSAMIKLSPNGDNDYEWSVEQSAPVIDYFAVKYRAGKEEENHYETVYSGREWYNHCRAELKVSDATAGLREINWYINDELVNTEKYSTKVTSSDTLTQLIDSQQYPSDDASYSVYAEILDNAGNVTKTDPIRFKMDDIAPTMNVAYDDKVYNKDTAIPFKVKDEGGSGLNYVRVQDSDGNTIDCKLEKPNEEGWYESSFDATIKGEYTITAVDHAGNVDSWTKDIQMISNEIPACPEITINPAEPDGENGWYKTLPAVTVQNVKVTEDKTPVVTKYQMWLEGENPLNETTISGDMETKDVPGEGIYNIKAWSISASGVSCAASAQDEMQVKVDTVAPDIDFKISKGNGASILINFTVKDTGSGVNKDTIKVLHGSQEIVAELTETDDVYTGNFEVTSTGNYSIVASDNAGNEAEAAAFTPMSMKVRAVTNISASSATLGANVYKGTFDIANVSIAYRKLSEEEFTEAQTMCVKDDKGNEVVSVVLSDLTESTDYVFKVIAVSAAPSDSDAGEVLEYEGYFKTLSSSNSGISVKGTARYSTSQKGEITVGVFEGNVCIMATEVNAGDEFTFNNVPDGNYSVVATDGVYSKTMRLLIQDGVVVYPTKYIDLILSGKNTAVVITSSDTPNVTADNMDSIFEDDPINYTIDDAELIEAGGTVEFKLYASLMTVSGVSADEISAMYAVTDNNKIVGAYLDLSLYKIVTDVDGTVDRKRVTELARGANVSVTIPLGELAGKSGLEVVRIHDTGDRYVGTSLQDMDNNPNTYTITTSQFSTYAVLYNPDKKEEPTTEPVTEQTTEAIKDGTSNPASNGNINSGNTSTNVDPDRDDTKTNKNNKKESGKNSSGVKTSSVGSLRSSGTAKTGDAAPVAVLGFAMFMSMAGFIILKRKNQR